MRILLLVDDYLPHSTKIGAKMMHELAVALVSELNHVTVITPDYSISKSIEISKLDSVEILKFKTPNVKHSNKLKRAFNESIISINAFRRLNKVLKKRKFDLIITYSPTIFYGPFVKYLKRKWNAKSYLVLRDIFPQWVIDNGMIKESSLIAGYFRYFEKLNYKAADRIGLQSPKNLELFNERYGLNDKTEVLYNWGDTSIPVYQNQFRKKYGLDDKIILFYGGNMGEAQDMMNLVRLAQNLENYNNLKFVFAGSGNEYELVKNAIAYRPLSNILLLDPVPQEQYNIMLSESDIGLFTLNKKHSTHNFPGKLLGYMAHSLPILGSVNPGNDIIKVIDNKAGFVSENGDDLSFLKNALRLIFDENMRGHFGQEARLLLDSTFSVEAARKTICSIRPVKGV